MDSSEPIGQGERKPCPFCGFMLYKDEKFPETFGGLRRGTEAEKVE